MQRYSSLLAGFDRPAAARSAATSLSLASVNLASTSARSRRALISVMNASFSAVVGCAVTYGWGAADGGSWLWNRAFQASSVFRCSQIPAPAMPSNRTAHRPSHGNSQRVRGMGCRYSGRSRSIRPPKASCAHSSRGVGAAPLRKRLTRADGASAPVPAGLLLAARRRGQSSPPMTAFPGDVPRHQRGSRRWRR